MKMIKLATEYGSTVTMEQTREGSKVKITVHYGTGNGRGYDMIWTDADNANKFYKNRLADGFKLVK